MKTIKYLGDEYKVISEGENTITAVYFNGVSSVLQVSFHDIWDKVDLRYQVVILTDRSVDLIFSERVNYYDAV